MHKSKVQKLDSSCYILSHTLMCGVYHFNPRMQLAFKASKVRKITPSITAIHWSRSLKVKSHFGMRLYILSCIDSKLLLVIG